MLFTKFPQAFDNAVCLYLRFRYMIGLIKQQAIDYWCIQGSSVQASDVALIAVVRILFLDNPIVFLGRTFCVKRHMFPCALWKLNKSVPSS
jgi:hypothetical protein